MDSPLSDIDANEIIADSEDEGYRGEHTVNNTFTSKSFEPLHVVEREQAPINMSDGQIDYFAGFNHNMHLPAPSIAERAKTRQRKPKAKPPQDVLELTDDDELMLNLRPSKSRKKKAKEKSTQDLPEINQGAGFDSTSARPIVEPTSGHSPLINARNKVRPRPVKKTPLPLHSPQPDPISQVALPNSTSPLHPPPSHFADSSSRVELPPSDPPLLSSLAQDRDTHLPPIEFLPQEDTDTPLPSSLPGEHVDELQDRHDRPDVDHGNILPPPPPTFFAGSSSLPLPIAHTPQFPLQLIDIVDLTDVPSTAIAPSMGAPDPSIKAKAKKPRKPRKGDIGDMDPDAIESPQASSRKKGKAKMNQVTVEIPLPSYVADRGQDAVSSVTKRRRKQILDDSMEEDELNIGAGRSDLSVDVPVNRPSPPFEGNNKQPQGDVDIFDPDNLGENFLKAEKYRGKKRRSVKEADGDIPSATIPRKKKKAPHPIEAGEQERTPEEDLTVPSKRISTKGKEVNKIPGKDDNTKIPRKRGVKDKRKMVIASDDDCDDNVDPVGGGLRALSPDPEEHLNVNVESPPEDDAAKAADHQDDRNVLRPIQLTEAQNNPSNSNTVMAPQKRYETPTAKYPSLASRYTIAPKNKISGMTELIRRASSHVNSPLAGPNARGSPSTRPVYSPLLKSSRRSLSQIAPLHLNRKTPPPPLPPPPPKKKSKKEQELEEKWEEEIIEEVGGVSEWLALSEVEKKDLKRLKRDREMGYCED